MTDTQLLYRRNRPSASGLDPEAVHLTNSVQDSSEELWRMDDAEVEEYWLTGVADRCPDFDFSDVN